MVRQVDRALVDLGPFLVDLTAEFVDAKRGDQDLDARLVHVVAAAVAVIDPQNRFHVGQQLAGRQVLADRRADVRGAAHAAADHDLETQHAIAVAAQGQADVVGARRRAVLCRGRHRELELARQERKLWVETPPPSPRHRGRR